MADGAEQGRSVLVTAPRRSLGKRLNEVRRRRGWSADDLAQACARIGAPELNRSVIANIESGRRTYVDVGEWLALSYALDVAPINLLIPTRPDLSADEQWISVTSDRWFKLGWIRQWIRGRWAPSDVDLRVFYSEEVPPEEWDPPKMAPEMIDEHSDRLREHRELVAQFAPHEAHPDAARTIREARRAEARMNETDDAVVPSAAAAPDGQEDEGDGGAVSVKSDLEVKPGTDGTWRILKPGARRASAKAANQSTAMKRASELLVKHGGGKIIQYGVDGKASQVRTVDSNGNVKSG